jgi:hypothetical protein
MGSSTEMPDCERGTATVYKITFLGSGDTIGSEWEAHLLLDLFKNIKYTLATRRVTSLE